MPFRALAVVLSVVYFLARKAQLSLSVIGVAVDFLQVVSLFSSFGFAWPEELTSLFKAASASTVNEQLVRGVDGVPSHLAPRWFAVLLLDLFQCSHTQAHLYLRCLCLLMGPAGGSRVLVWCCEV